MTNPIDRLLNHLTMYRLMLYYAAGLWALAFGLGGRHLARRYLERRFSDQRMKKKKENDLSPL